MVVCLNGTLASSVSQGCPHAASLLRAQVTAGVQVAVRAKRGKRSGKCDVYLDDQHQGCIDMFRMYSQFCIVYRSQPLQHGR